MLREARVRQGNHDTSTGLWTLTQPVKLEPHYAASYCYRGVAYLSEGEYDKAITDFDSALDLDPEHPLNLRSLERLGSL